MFFARVVVCALCALLVSPAAAIVVQDGDYYERLDAPDSLVMTGGEVNELRLGPASNLETLFFISGGTLQQLITYGGGIDISGGQFAGVFSGIERSDDLRDGRSPITLHGWYFRYRDRMRQEYNSYMVTGWLADGSWIEIGISNNYQTLGNAAIQFVIEPNDGLPGDMDGDWSVDVIDLNFARNNFGNPLAVGDVDGDGLLGIAELNQVRNHFDPHTFLNPDYYPGQVFEVTHSQSIFDPRMPMTSNNPVPEPSSLFLLVMALGAASLSKLPSRYRRRCQLPPSP